MLEWFNEIVLWAFNNSRVTFAIIVIITMVAMGSAVGLLIDLIMRGLGLRMDKYTDSHTK